MIHSIKFKDIGGAIEKAKAEAKKADADWDKEYASAVREKKRREKADAEYMAKHAKDPEKYPEWRRPKSGLWEMRFGRIEKRTRDTDWKELIRGPYQNALEALNGKTFTFTPGLNVIVGANGVGKTSLLKVIREITFAEKQDHSSLIGVPYWSLGLDGTCALTDCCEIKADYRHCVFNLRTFADIDMKNPMDHGGIGTMLQLYEGNTQSKGEKGSYAIASLMQTFQIGKGMDINDPKNPRSMKCEVLSVMEKELERTCDDYAKRIRKVLDYYKANQVDDGKFAILLDEPDAGFDVFRALDLCRMLERMADDSEKIVIQPVVVLHNAAIIARLMRKPNVNFIELTPDYLNTVKKFMEENA